MSPRRSRVVYAMFAEADKGRVWDGKRWVKVDPRDIVRATQQALAAERAGAQRD